MDSHQFAWMNSHQFAWWGGVRVLMGVVGRATLCTLPNTSKSLTVVLHTSTAGGGGLAQSEAPGKSDSEERSPADGDRRQ